MAGKNEVADFDTAYGICLDDLAAITPRLVLATPPPFEKGPVRDLSQKNTALAEYSAAIRRLAQARQLQVVDLGKQLEGTRETLTSDGLQLSPHGQEIVAAAFAREVGASDLADLAGAADKNGAWSNPAFEQLRQEVRAKNRLWFDYWRPQNWAFLGGDRTVQPSSSDHRDPKIRWLPEAIKRFTSLIADAVKSFADGLMIPTGLELTNDGAYVGHGPELLLLRDTDGDDRADERTVVLRGFGTGDNHQNINSFTWSPSGELWMCQGLHILSRVETVYGLVELNKAGIWRLGPA